MSLRWKTGWLNYSLRTLLIAVAIFSLWFGWQMHIVRERAALRALIEKRGGWIGPIADDPYQISNRFSNEKGPPAPEAPPLVRQWLGDESIDYMQIDRDSFTAGELNRIESAFPEAVIHTGL